MALSRILLTALVLQPAFAAPIIYMVEERQNSDLLLRFESGTLTTVGSGIGHTDVRGLAFDHTTSTLYGVSRLSSRLLTINTATAAGQPVSDNDYLPPGSNTAEITVDAEGNMYGTGHLNDATTADTLLAVNRASGVATAINPGGLDVAMLGLAFLHATNTLYGTTINGDLYTINPTLGTASLLGTITNSNGGVARIAFDQDTGTLYGITFNHQLVTVDLATLNATEVAQLNPDNQIYAIAVVNPVPEPSTLLLAGSAAILSLLARRRQAS